MKLNIITNEPEKVLKIIQTLYDKAIVTHTSIRSNIHSFEILEEGDPKVYTLEGLRELSHHSGISYHNIRIY